MKRRNLIYVLTGAVFLAAVIISLIVLRRSSAQRVEVVQDGAVIRVIDLTVTDEDIRIPSPDGSSYNILSVHGGQVCVSEAGCPDQTCVHMGALKSDNLPIVCLPNRLIVRFAEESP